MTETHRTQLIITFSAAFFLTACSAHELTKGEAAEPGHGISQQSAAGHESVVYPTAYKQFEKSAGNTLVLDLTKKQGVNSIVPRLSQDRVVYVGETHDRFDHHLNQLEVIRQLHRSKPNIAIGMEFFQQPFQPVLDDYIGGRISEKEMLLKTEWYKRWRYDYRLYRPIMRYAREHAVPVIALNVAGELIERVSAVGLAGLSQAERSQMPREMDNSDKRYRERIQSVYQGHPHAGKGGFARFLEVQLAWDEGMAERIVRFLRENPDGDMVVLAGSGHLMYGTGIPNRVRRRLPLASHIILPADNIALNPDIADFVVYPEQVQLPPAGLLGVLLDRGDEGVRVSGLLPNSAAAQAGIEEGDYILRLNGEAVNDTAGIKVRMLDKSPGDSVELQVLRKRVLLEDKILQFEFELGRE